MVRIFVPEFLFLFLFLFLFFFFGGGGGGLAKLRENLSEFLGNVHKALLRELF